MPYPDHIVTDPVEIIDRRLKAVKDTQAAIKRLRDVFVLNWGPIAPGHDPMEMTLGQIYTYAQQRERDLEAWFGPFRTVELGPDRPAPRLAPEWKDVRP